MIRRAAARLWARVLNHTLLSSSISSRFGLFSASAPTARFCPLAFASLSLPPAAAAAVPPLVALVAAWGSVGGRSWRRAAEGMWRCFSARKKAAAEGPLANTTFWTLLKCAVRAT